VEDGLAKVRLLSKEIQQEQQTAGGIVRNCLALGRFREAVKGGHTHRTIGCGLSGTIVGKVEVILEQLPLPRSHPRWAGDWAGKSPAFASCGSAWCASIQV